MFLTQWVPKLGNNTTSYELLPKDESSETTSPRGQSATGFKRYAYVGIALATILGFVYLYMSPKVKYKSGDRQQSTHTRFRLITIATEKDEKLCKTVLSAEALGYPTPALVKWEMELDAADPEFGGTHIAKIPGVLDYLNGLDPESDDDVVFLIDGYDLWLQLRPETLLQRYYDLLKHEDERVRSESGGVTSIRHNIVYNAQKRCWPLESDDPICVAVPGGALPEDIFGPNTDDPGRPTENEKEFYHRLRPRWLNAGSFMGQAAALRAMFTRALEKANADPSATHDQGFSSAVFGEQEYVRRYGYDRQSSDSNETTFKPEKGKNYEFGIALDTKQELILSTAWSTTQTEWLRWADQDLAREFYKNHGTPKKYRQYKLPKDITRTPRPSTLPDPQAEDDSDLTNTTSAAANDLPKTWEDAPLYTHMRTGVVPVAVHHNHNHRGAKAFIQTMWNETWFQPHLRTLLDAQARHATDQVARFDLNGDGTIHEWSAEHKLRIGGYKGTDHGGEFLGFQGLCSGYEGELFRDGGAPWTDPNLPR